MNKRRIPWNGCAKQVFCKGAFPNGSMGTREKHSDPGAIDTMEETFF
jgi:hypothetical protein